MIIDGGEISNSHSDCTITFPKISDGYLDQSGASTFSCPILMNMDDEILDWEADNMEDIAPLGSQSFQRLSFYAQSTG